MMWFVNDFFVNLFLSIRLYYFVFFNSKRFYNIKNDIKKDGWILTFNDEFDDGELDRKKWRTDSYYGLRFHPGNIKNKGIAPDVYYDDSCFEFENSILKQKMNNKPKNIRYIDWSGKDWGNFKIPYRAGQIDSSNYFKQKYGYFEIRSKVSKEKGVWPAFWLASTNSWPPEVDVYEIYTGKKGGLFHFESNFHWLPTENRKMKVGKHRVLNVSEGFHTYAVEWDENGFKIFYNNLLVRVFSNPKAIEFFSHPMHIIIGVVPHINHGIEDANFPNYHEIDYVRAYERKK